jgi:DNA modification methylase
MTPPMAQRIELWPIERLLPYARNPRTHSEQQVAAIAASMVEFGFNDPIEVTPEGLVIAGHGRLLAARKLGWRQVPVLVLEHLDETRRRAYAIANNRTAEAAGWDEELLALELKELAEAGLDATLTGFEDQEIAALLAGLEGDAEGAEPEEEIPEAPAQAVTQPGDLWLIGPHRLICGDCRDYGVIAKLFEHRKANVVVTSPPYATQREYDPASGFKPIRPEEYLEWYRDVAANLASILAPDGSYFLNIKEHAEEGQRHLYVKKLVIAHVEEWGWRFVDEFCWRKTDEGVPGGWNNRFKNAWEPIFHFARTAAGIKFRPRAVGHFSDGCFDYSPDTPRSNSGSGLLGEHEDRHKGIARPSNVIEAKTESSQGSHTAPFPRAIPEFFIKAFSDPGDVIFDPFLGSGTTVVAAALLDRIGYGIEISPAYCDVALRRLERAAGLTATLEGRNFDQVAAERGIDPYAEADLRRRDSRSIRRKPNGMPCYAPKGAAR